MKDYLYKSAALVHAGKFFQPPSNPWCFTTSYRYIETDRTFWDEVPANVKVHPHLMLLHTKNILL